MIVFVRKQAQFRASAERGDGWNLSGPRRLAGKPVVALEHSRAHRNGPWISRSAHVSTALRSAQVRSGPS